MKIVQRPKNSRLIQETARFFEYVESTLIPANEQYLKVYETALQKLKQDFDQAKATAQQEIDEAVVKGSSKEEAYECSNMRNIIEEYEYERFEMEYFKEQALVHSKMHVVVLIQSHMESMLLLLCKEHLDEERFKVISKKRIEVVKEYLKGLGLQQILSRHHYCVISKFGTHRNDYIHDQYFTTKERDPAEVEKYMLESPSMKVPFTRTEFENYLGAAKQIMKEVYSAV
jgi:hypothetical protein